MNVCKCCCNLFNNSGRGGGDLKTGESYEGRTLKPKKRQRISLSNFNYIDENELDSDKISSERSIDQKGKKITFVQEPDIGFLWVLVTDIVRWITSPLISSIVVFGLSFWFTMIHINAFKECKLTTEFRLDGLEIKQQWRNSTMAITYGEECSMQQNPILSNLGSIMVFFLTIALGAGLDKYKETLRMYEEITGDIKAMGMIMVHLTFDHEKYFYDEKEDKLKYREKVQTVYRKIRYLLASLGPTVKNTLAGGEYAVRTVKSRLGVINCPSYIEIGKYCQPQLKWVDPFTAISDRKYYIVRTDRGICDGFLLPKTYELRNYWKDSIVKFRLLSEIQKQCNEKKKIVANPADVEKEKEEAEKHFEKAKKARDILDKELLENIDHEIQYALYSKIEDIHDKTNMDAFECTMTVLLDELMRLFENGLGFGEDEGSAVVSAAIDRWNAIYATWGTMASLKTFSEPFAVNMFRLLLVGTYAYFVPIGYLKYVGTDIEDFIMLYVAGEMFIFCLMWWLAFAVRNPFKNSWVIRNVNTLAYSTQYQVLHLMAKQEEFDKKDYDSNSKYGYIRKYRDIPTNPNWNHYEVFEDNKKSPEEKALERLIEAVNRRNITITNDNSELERIIKEAFNKMNDQTKVTLKEIKDIIEIIMKEIKKYDRDALADELNAIIRDNKPSGVRPGRYGTPEQREEDLKRRKRREEIRQRLMPAPSGKTKRRKRVSSYLAF